LRFVLKALLFVKFLFAIGEHEFLVAVSADNGFVGHFDSPVFYWGSNILGFPENTRNGHMGMLNHFFLTMFKCSIFCQYIFLVLMNKPAFSERDYFYPAGELSAIFLSVNILRRCAAFYL